MPFHNPLAGAAAPGAGEFDVPGRIPRCGAIIGRAERGGRGRRPARLAGAGRHIGPGEDQETCGCPGLSRQRQSPGDGQIGMRRIGIADHHAKGTGFQRLLHGPQQRLRLLQRDGDEALPLEAQPLQPMAIKPPMLALLGGQPAPQKRPAFLGVGQAAQRQRQRKAHGGGLVTIGAGRHIMQARPHQPLRRQVPVDLGQAGKPRRRPALHRLELRVRLLDAGNMLPERRDQRFNALAVTESGNRRKSLPAPQNSCRFHTHDCNIQNVPILFSYMNRRVKMGKSSRFGTGVYVFVITPLYTKIDEHQRNAQQFP